MEKLKILVVEDDRSTKALYKHGLNEQIFDRQFVDTGKAALAAYLEWVPDIIILDIGLPDIDGISILKELREKHKDTSKTIIVASALSERENVVECMKIGIQGFIVKPFNIQIISDKILHFHNKNNNKIDIDSEIVAEMAKYDWSNLEIIEGKRKVNLHLGIEIIIQIDGVEARLKSFITGIHHGEYILIQCPKMTALETKLHEGNSVRVIYLSSGTVCSFEAKILNFINNPMRLIFLSYPETEEVHELRKSQRVNCLLNASVRINDHDAEYNGLVLDISEGGCRFVADSSSSALPPLQVGDRSEMTLELPGSRDTIFFSGELRNIAQDSKRISVGIRFTQCDSEAKQSIDKYVKTIMHLI